MITQKVVYCVIVITHPGGANGHNHRADDERRSVIGRAGLTRSFAILTGAAGFTNADSNGGVMANTAIKELTASELNELLSHRGVVLADFSTTWCSPCRAMEPIVERLAARFDGRADVVKIDVDRAGELASAHGVRGLPTFLFADGQVVERIVGTASETALAALIESQLAPARKDSQPLATV
jgi:thioredoxin 1